MKKLALASVTALVLATSVANATSTDPIFYADQGKVVLPSLKLGAKIYYIILRQLPATNGNYDFRADMSTVTDLTPPLSYTPASAAEIIGSWTPSGTASGSSVTLNANGTYTMIQGASGGDADCPNGGPESGTYQYEPSNGLFTAVATSDSNGQCGFSHPDGASRLKKVGTDIYLFFKDGNDNVELKLIKKP